MIILRQSIFASVASFKPKFRQRFRNGDFTYIQAKDPNHEALNHQAYREVAAEDEFKNNPETYKIRQGLFSEKISKEDRKKLERSRDVRLAGAGIGAAGLLANTGVDINRLIKGRNITSSGTTLALMTPAIGTAVYNQLKIKKMYKKYHPEVKNPTQKDLVRWINEVEIPQNLADMKKLKKRQESESKK